MYERAPGEVPAPPDRMNTCGLLLTFTSFCIDSFMPEAIICHQRELLLLVRFPSFTNFIRFKPQTL